MKLIIQRVLRSQVLVNGELVSRIGPGIMVLIGITHKDTKLDFEQLGSKLLKLRLWPNEMGNSWAKNIVEMNYEIMLVSQFTLYH